MNSSGPITQAQFASHAREDAAHFTGIEVSLDGVKKELGLLREDIKGIVEIFNTLSSGKKMLFALAGIVTSSTAILYGVRKMLSLLRIW